MGANLALADAEALGECMAAVVSGGQAAPAAHGRFEEVRQPPSDAACLLAAGSAACGRDATGPSFGRGAAGDERRREHGAPGVHAARPSL